MRRSLFQLLAPLLLAPLAMAGCSDGSEPRIGVVMSTAPQKAALLAASEQSGHDAGRFEPMLLSPTAKRAAQEAIEQANQFVTDPRVIAVVGHTNSASSIAASQIYNAAGLVQIAPTTTSPKYDDAGPYSFRLVPSDTLQAAYLDRVRRHHWPDARRIAVVHVNDDYGRGLVRQLRPRLDTLVFEGLHADHADSADLALLTRRIVEYRPELVFWLGRPSTLGAVLPDLLAALPGLDVVCSDACDAGIVYRNPGGRFTGMHFVRFTDPAAPDSAVRSFQERYRELTGEVATSEAMLTYDAVSLVRAALRAGAQTREDVKRYFDSLGVDRPAFQGLSGPIRFNGTRTAARKYMLAEVRADSVVSAHRM